jgi:hypothetical protein
MKQFSSVRSVALARLALGASAALILCGLSGCYEHVVDAKGLNTDGVTVYERQQSNTWIDRQLFGDPRPVSSTKVVRQE